MSEADAAVVVDCSAYHEYNQLSRCGQGGTFEKAAAVSSTCLFHVSDADDVWPVLQSFSKKRVGHS